MSRVKEHYDNHLAGFYSWMLGNLKDKGDAFLSELSEAGINPGKGAFAVDLGAGSGLHSLALARAGWKVTAIDFCEPLLRELQDNAQGKDIHTVNDDILNLNRYAAGTADLIVCAGDTLTHLEKQQDVINLIETCFKGLKTGGYLYLAFRDYTQELTGNARFIPVKSDDYQILTCFLEFNEEHILVSDILYKKTGGEWKLNVSSYPKLKLNPERIGEVLSESGLTVLRNLRSNNLLTITAQKQ